MTSQPPEELRKILHNYTNPLHPCYNKDFTQKLAAILPEWLPRRTRKNEMRQEVMNFVYKYGRAPSPAGGTQKERDLGGRLHQYFHWNSDPQLDLHLQRLPGYEKPPEAMRI
jgi:hypothetical protein